LKVDGKALEERRTAVGLQVKPAIVSQVVFSRCGDLLGVASKMAATVWLGTVTFCLKTQKVDVSYDDVRALDIVTFTHDVQVLKKALASLNAVDENLYMTIAVTSSETIA
jgi:hypothetical protein